MPYSFFTRLMAGLLMLGFAAGILWGDGPVYQFGQFELMSAPVLVAMLVWSAVRDTAPFYDKAFHRTLPPGDAAAFWRMLRLPLVLIGWVMLLVAVYCWRLHFSWRVGSYGVAMLIVPMLAIMGVTGVFATFTTARITPERRSLVMMIAVPLVSWALLYWLRCNRGLRVWLGIDTDASGYPAWYYLSHWRLLVLTGAVLGPLAWWLVAVKRLWTLGGAFAVAVVACLPWFGFYGDFFKWAPDAGPVPAEVNPLHLTRKVEPDTDAVGVPVGDLLTLEGLEKDEFAMFQGSGLEIHEVWPGQSMRFGGSIRRTNLSAGLSDAGEVVWGESTIWEALRKKLPGNPPLLQWQEILNQPRELQILRPEKIDPADRTRFMDVQLAGRSERWRGSWGFYQTLVIFGQPLVFDLAKGGSALPPGGGLMKVEPPHATEDGEAITMTIYSEGLWTADGPWLEPAASGPRLGSEPWFILVDESGGQAYAIRPAISLNGEHVLLGTKERWDLGVKSADREERRRNFELMKRCRLYVFWPEVKSAMQVEVPPPGQ